VFAQKKVSRASAVGHRTNSRREGTDHRRPEPPEHDSHLKKGQPKTGCYTRMPRLWNEESEKGSKMTPNSMTKKTERTAISLVSKKETTQTRRYPRITKGACQVWRDKVRKGRGKGENEGF